MPLSERQQAELLARYMARSAVLADAGSRTLAAALDGLPFTDAGVVEFRRRALPLMEALSTEASGLSSGYMSTLLERSAVAAAEFVEPDWRGPFIRFWSMVDEHGYDAALTAARSQAEAAGEGSVVSTLRRTAGLVEDDRITGWKRVPDFNACQWCRDISGNTYRSAASADFGHDRCQCGVTPVLR